MPPTARTINTRVLGASLAAAVVISIGGGYLLSRSDDSDPSPAEDSATITSGGLYTAPAEIPTNNAVQGEPLPIVELTDIDGNSFSTADLIGQPLVINVWATYCEPCKREMPALARVQHDLGDTVRFVGVNAAQNTESALAFAADKGVQYELFSDINGGALQEALGITGLPYTIFVAADGTIVAQKGLEITEETIRSTIADELLA